MQEDFERTNSERTESGFNERDSSIRTNSHLKRPNTATTNEILTGTLRSDLTIVTKIS